MVVRLLIQAKIYENYSSERKIKARRVKKVIEVKGYNSKIISAGKDWREEVLKLEPGSDTTLKHPVYKRT